MSREEFRGQGGGGKGESEPANKKSAKRKRVRDCPYGGRNPKKFTSKAFLTRNSPHVGGPALPVTFDEEKQLFAHLYAAVGNEGKPPFQKMASMWNAKITLYVLERGR